MQKIQALSTAQKRWCSLGKNYKKSPYCVWEGFREYFSTSGAESLHVGGARQIDKICNLKSDLSLRSIISQSSWLRGQHRETAQGDEAQRQHDTQKLYQRDTLPLTSCCTTRNAANCDPLGTHRPSRLSSVTSS